MITDPLTGFSNLFNFNLTSPFAAIGVGLYFVYETSFLWLPIILIWGGWRLWINYKQAKFIFSQKPILLEVRLPLDIVKPPQNMELFLSTLFQTGGEGTWYDRSILGKTRPWFSLELASIEGKVKFYIWSRAAWRNHIEAQLYAQFPGIEVFEVPDYTLPMRFDPEKNILWGCEYALNKPDPFPIKTYQNKDDFSLMLLPGTPTEFQVDPISVVLEYMSSLGPGEQAWLQILMRAHKADRRSTDRRWYNPFSWGKKADWKQTLKQEMKKLQDKEKRSKAEQDALEAMERKLNKLAFETGIRALYIAEKEHFNSTNIAGLSGSFKQYNANNFNGFKPTNTTSVDFPWQDYKNTRVNGKRRVMLDAYKRRSYFFPPYKRHHFILNAEELATIYHFPSAAVTTPGLERIATKKAEPPVDLPI
ncbi:MAG TPA: hypothetical protein VHF05_03710 [Candidatus Paceibacterota bacterium]|jgi:hypothetical protein|nr:hypothetical protein [Candidatus Paceibacterota bacterium]